RDGTTHVIFEPLDFIARLAALVPPPRLNLTRFHGVFAPNSLYRARITPARRGRGGKPKRPEMSEDRTPTEQRSAMQWAKRLKRVFQIDVETCPNCGGTVQVIACTRNGSTSGLLALRASRPCVHACAEDPPVIERILRHLASKDVPGLWPDSRAPPGRPVGLLQ
ncbi:MAG: transposase, partial [Wenzhouxiangella sp.]|nr:transposase [Wenzhouxiangella sp.]